MGLVLVLTRWAATGKESVRHYQRNLALYITQPPVQCTSLTLSGRCIKLYLLYRVPIFCVNINSKQAAHLSPLLYCYTLWF